MERLERPRRGLNVVLGISSPKTEPQKNMEKIVFGGLGAFREGFGPLFSLLGRLGAVLGRHWTVLERFWAGLWLSWCFLGPSYGILGRSCDGLELF